MRYQNVCIESLATAIPSISVSTAEIEESLRPLYARLGMKPGWLQSVTGIRNRRFWEKHLKPSDVATRAANKTLERSRIPREKIGALVSCSVSKDYIEPAVAAFVHGNLKLPRNCLNFDAGNACLGFLTGMMIVGDMIELGRIEVGLVVAGENSRPPTEANGQLAIY